MKTNKAQWCSSQLYTKGGNHAVEFTATEKKNRYKIKTHCDSSLKCIAAYKIGLAFLISWVPL